MPARDGIVLRIFRADSLPANVAALDGTQLYLPRAGDGRTPFKRTLGWFAWLAKGARPVSPDVQAELDAALSASASSAGTQACASLVARARSVGRVA